LDNDNEKDLISPCLCTGGSAYVHRKCLDNWRSINKDGRSFKYCDVCQFEYIIEPVIDDPSADRKRLWIFRLLVTRDILLILLLFQAIIIGMTFSLEAMDKKNNSIKQFYPTSMSSFLIYYLSSLILFFGLLGLFGLIASCCGGLSSNDNNNGSTCACGSCFCLGSDCNGNDCGEGGGIIVIIMLLIFAIIGVFIGIIISGILIRRIIKRHVKKLWLKQETKKYVVKDFQGRRNELTNELPQQPLTELSTHTEIDKNKTDNISSVPVELLALTTFDTQ